MTSPCDSSERLSLGQFVTGKSVHGTGANPLTVPNFSREKIRAKFESLCELGIFFWEAL